MIHKLCSILIADDEYASRQYLRSLVKDDSRFLIKAVCASGAEAIDKAGRLKPDALLLDIKMPIVDGFEVVKNLSYEPIIVFVTAFGEHALDAYQHKVFDYVTKPIAPTRFETTLTRIYDRYVEKSSRIALETQTNISKETAPTKLLHTINGEVVYTETAIHYIESDDNYINVHINHQVHRVRQTLSKFLSTLESANMLQIHRSFAVNLKYASRIIRSSGQMHLELTSGETIPISRSRREEVIKALTESADPR